MVVITTVTVVTVTVVTVTVVTMMFMFLLTIVLVLTFSNKYSNNQFTSSTTSDDSEVKIDKILSMMISFNNSLSSRIDDLSRKVEDVRAELTANMQRGFSSIHNTGSDRYAILSAVTQYNYANDGSGNFSTAHAVAYGGKVCMVSVSHVEGTSSDALDCGNIDVSLFPNCPSSKWAINIENYVPLRTGDRASALGYIYEHGEMKERYWEGSLAGKLGNFISSYSRYIYYGSYVFQSVLQLSGMSGGAAVNGYGYTGMVNSVLTYTSSDRLVNNAIVIPAELIVQCIEKYSSKLKSVEDCPNITILELPKASLGYDKYV